MEWTQWCRLCAKEEQCSINIFETEDKTSSLADSVARFFALHVEQLEEIPQNICTLCNEFLLCVQDFCTTIQKTQQMFLEISFNLKSGNEIDSLEIKKKYTQTDTNNRLEAVVSEHKLFNSMYLDVKPTIVNGSIFIATEEDILNTNTLTESTIDLKETLLKDLLHSELDTPIVANDTANVIDSNDQFDDKKLNLVAEQSSKNSIAIERRKRNHRRGVNSTSKLKKEQRSCRKSNEIRQKLDCEECHMKFARESNYVCHLKKVHNLSKPLLPCNICGRVCKTKQKLKYHMELHLPSEERAKLLFKCPECDQKFTQKGAMRSHVRAQHLLEKPFICEQCGKKFASHTNLWSHKRSHDDQNHHTCPKCPKVFKNEFRLKVHMRGHNDSCHPCSVCGLVLKTMNTLKNHMLVHSDVKAFKCNFCGKDFKRDKNLQNHMITHSGLRPFVCRFCGQSYANRSNCKKHEKHAHPNEYESAASVSKCEPQQKVLKKLPNIRQLEAMLEQIKSKGEITEVVDE